jgi:hypothetical protein
VHLQGYARIAFTSLRLCAVNALTFDEPPQANNTATREVISTILIVVRASSWKSRVIFGANYITSKDKGRNRFV